MSSVDRAGDDSGAERLVKGMTQALGTEKMVELISARVNVRWKILLAKSYQQSRDWANAVRLVDELVQQDLATLDEVQKLKVLSIAGLVYHAAGTSVPGSLDKAEKTYEQYLAMLEKHRAGAMARVQALNNLALLLAEHPVSPDVSRALGYSQRAYDVMDELNRFDASIADTHGWVLVLADRVDEAIPLLRAAAAKEPPIPDPFYHLGEAYIRKSMPDEAQNSLSRAQDLIKNYTEKGMFIDPTLGPKVEAALAKAKAMPKSASASGTP
jgi:tetratricopeptide (TPR) repeat protein